MKESLEQLEQCGLNVILGRDNTPKAKVLRIFLHLLSKLYTGIVQMRLWLFRRRYLRDHHLGCVVISIGNLTVGGTGKTPVVEIFAKALQKGGRNVAILSRGYKSQRKKVKRGWRRRLVFRNRGQEPPRVVSDGGKVLLSSLESGDEPYMLANNLPGVPVVVDKNRVKGGLHAIRHFNADTLLLDDGLQYLRLSHQIDVVLVDRTAPFGNEYLLPRGTLREPPPNLRRADYIFLTKCNGESNEELVKRLRCYNRTAEIIECTHSPRYLEDVYTGERKPLSLLDGKYVGAISGIAVPDSFESGLRRLNANVEVVVRYTDHYRYTERDVREFIDRCVDRDMDMVVTTEKDAVRFPVLEHSDLPVYFLRVEIEILGGAGNFEQCIRRICRPNELVGVG